jgi:hypothetical protein
MKIEKSQSLLVNAPEFFEDEAFRAWLNDSGKRKFTWHQSGTPDEWADTVVLVDPGLSGEGADSDMPEHIWDQIVSICRSNFEPTRSVPHIMVRLTNVRE